MKALTLYQPWATLIAIGAKRIETRSWSTPYRGPLAIHAGKCKDYILQHNRSFICNQLPFEEALRKAGYDLKWLSLPLGAIVATCELVDVERIYANSYIPGKPEFMFGNYSIGRFMWKLEQINILPISIPAKGAMGLWEWHDYE
jgi:activating signal cointegrator 1